MWLDRSQGANHWKAKPNWAHLDGNREAFPIRMHVHNDCVVCTSCDDNALSFCSICSCIAKCTGKKRWWSRRWRAGTTNDKELKCHLKNARVCSTYAVCRMCVRVCVVCPISSQRWLMWYVRAATSWAIRMNATRYSHRCHRQTTGRCWQQVNDCLSNLPFEMHFFWKFQCYVRGARSCVLYCCMYELYGRALMENQIQITQWIRFGFEPRIFCISRHKKTFQWNSKRLDSFLGLRFDRIVGTI